MARLMKSARGILALVVSFSLALVLGLVPMTSANAAEIAISGMPKESIPAAFGGELHGENTSTVFSSFCWITLNSIAFHKTTVTNEYLLAINHAHHTFTG